MKYTISKEFHFSASHQLEGLPDDHPCRRLHGHNYILTIVLAADDLDHVGFVQDYNDLKPIKDYVDDQLDHRHLNDVFRFNTTVELMSKHLYDLFKPTFPKMIAIELSETPKTKCRYEP
jgi:6-pyruvoyltetrahydropterin/6-carboxytetrahydropterin synthase